MKLVLQNKKEDRREGIDQKKKSYGLRVCYLKMKYNQWGDVINAARHKFRGPEAIIVEQNNMKQWADLQYF